MRKGVWPYFLVMLGLFGCGRFPKPPAEGKKVAHLSADWMRPFEPGFHGFAVKDAGWDMRSCQNCHGAELDGDKEGNSCKYCHAGKKLDDQDMPHQRPPSCLTCHRDSPRACNTCHGNERNPAPPRAVMGQTKRTYIGVGAHQSHVQASPFTRGFLCTQCHKEPESGHYDTDLPAEVAFGPAATGYGTFKPKWDRSRGTCSNVMCHGWNPDESKMGGIKWNSRSPKKVVCGDCHGLPPAKTPQGDAHPQDEACVKCHGSVVDANMHIINPALHVNGRFDGNGGTK